MNRKQWHDETIERLERAAVRLSERAERMHSSSEKSRLGGKLEGVKLALSYIREMPDEVEEEELGNAELLEKMRQHVRDAHYFADELEPEDFAILLGVKLEEQ